MVQQETGCRPSGSEVGQFDAANIVSGLADLGIAKAAKAIGTELSGDPGVGKMAESAVVLSSLVMPGAAKAVVVGAATQAAAGAATVAAGAATVATAATTVVTGVATAALAVAAPVVIGVGIGAAVVAGVSGVVGWFKRNW